MSTEKHKKKSTFEREMNDPEFKKAFDESYKELLLAECLTDNEGECRELKTCDIRLMKEAKKLLPKEIWEIIKNRQAT